MNNILEKKENQIKQLQTINFDKILFHDALFAKNANAILMLVEMVFKFYFDFGIFNLSSSKGLFDNSYYVNTLIIS